MSGEARREEPGWAGGPALRRPRPVFCILRSRPEAEGAEVSSGHAVPGKQSPPGGKAGCLLVKTWFRGLRLQQGLVAYTLPPRLAEFGVGNSFIKATQVPLQS